MTAGDNQSYMVSVEVSTPGTPRSKVRRCNLEPVLKAPAFSARAWSKMLRQVTCGPPVVPWTLVVWPKVGYEFGKPGTTKRLRTD